jgi:hypothetical protein
MPKNEGYVVDLRLGPDQVQALPPRCETCTSCVPSATLRTVSSGGMFRSCSGTRLRGPSPRPCSSACSRCRAAKPSGSAPGGSRSTPPRSQPLAQHQVDDERVGDVDADQGGNADDAHLDSEHANQLCPQACALQRHPRRHPAAARQRYAALAEPIVAHQPLGTVTVAEELLTGHEEHAPALHPAALTSRFSVGVRIRAFADLVTDAGRACRARPAPSSRIIVARQRSSAARCAGRPERTAACQRRA